MVHLIFVTKYRKKLLIGNIRISVKQTIFETCRKYHWYLKKIETDKDHAHLLVQYPPTDSVTRIVSILKQYSTYYLWKDYPSYLKIHYWKERTFWSDGYFAASIGQVSQSTIEHYIEHQG